MHKGLVIKSTGSWFTVRDPEGRIVNCKIKGTYRIKGIRATNPVAVGDRVEYLMEQGSDNGLITKIEVRKNYIIRRSPNLSKEYQLIAANVDQSWLMVSLVSPRTFPEFIDRFLVTAEAYSIPASLLFNKTDLYKDRQKSELHRLKAIYENIGYPCYEISARLERNTDILREKMKGRLNVISGNFRCPSVR
jgi:ribosome biogenesis GTPase